MITVAAVGSPGGGNDPVEASAAGTASAPSVPVVAAPSEATGEADARMDGETLCIGMFTQAFADAFADQAERGYDARETPEPGDGIRMGSFIETFVGSAGAMQRQHMKVDITDPVRGQTAFVVYQTYMSIWNVFERQQISFADTRSLVLDHCAQHRGLPAHQEQSPSEQQQPAAEYVPPPAVEPGYDEDSVIDECTQRLLAPYKDYLTGARSLEEVLADAPEGSPNHDGVKYAAQEDYVLEEAESYFRLNFCTGE